MLRSKNSESAGVSIYVGAGTSGRIGVQDGAELPPTFNWPDDKVVFLMAGGEGALLKAVENAEDWVEDGIARIDTPMSAPTTW